MPGGEDADAQLWERVCAAFGDALELPAGERVDYLRKLGSASVASEVVRLLREHDLADSFLECPALPAGQPPNDAVSSKRTFRDGDILCGRFRIVQLRGVGGMGEVYEAFDTELRQAVAVKTLRQSDFLDSGMVDRFRAEVLRSRQITHPNVGRVYDLFTDRLAGGEEILFFTMELLTGQTLSQWIASHGSFTPAAALPLIHEVADALGAAHRAGVIHRDLNPANIFLSCGADGSVSAIVTDFGIAVAPGAAAASATDACGATLSLLTGTPEYMAPEQICGDPVSPATDIYALGLVVHEMLAGGHAYNSASPIVNALRKLTPGGAPLQFGPEVPERMRRSIARSLRPLPSERFQSAGEFLRALEPKPMPRPLSWHGAGMSAGLRWVVLLGLLSLALVVAFLSRGLSPAAKPLASIAVLPFENIGGDPGAAYLSDGIAESITEGLTSYPALQVAARRAAFAYRDKSVPAARISRTLGAASLLIGSVSRSGDNLHVTVRLLRGTTGQPVWSRTFDRNAKDLIALNNDITRQVARLLGAFPGPSTETEPTSSPEAYDRYLQGRYLWNRRTRESLFKGLTYFEEAIQRDGKFALAYTGVADSYSVLSDYGWVSPGEAGPKIKDALDRSMALDSHCAETLASVGLYDNVFSWDQAGAERAFQQAIALKPSLLQARSWYGNYLMLGSRWDEALREAEIARRLDPVSLPTLVFLGWVRHYRREYDRAIEIGKRAVELNPAFSHGHQLLALSYAATGKAKEAIAESDAAIALTEDRAIRLRYRAVMLSLLPAYASETRTVVRELESLSQYRQAGYIVIIYAGLRDRDRMYYWADRALRLRDGALHMAVISPQLDPFRHEPRFRELQKQLGYSR